MARNPFPRLQGTRRFSESAMQFSDGDDNPPLAKEKDIVKKHGNDVESFSVMKSKSRKRSSRSRANALTTNQVNEEDRQSTRQRKQTDASTTSNGEEEVRTKQRKQRQRSQTNASTTSDDPFEDERTSRQRKQRQRNQPGSSTTSNGADKRASTKQRDHQMFQSPRGDQRSVTGLSDDYEEGNASERDRLLPANGSNSSPRPNGYGDAPENQIGFPPARPEATVQRLLPCISLSTERFFSIILFLLVLVLGMAFVISSNIKSDRFGLEITPRVVNYYLIVLITVFIIWLGFDLWRNRNCLEGTLKESGSLIPSHLLNGLGLFGIGSAICQAVTILDFLKCRRKVSVLDTSDLVYPFFEMAFMFSQIYIFYTLSMNRQRQMWFGNAFTMLTFGMNLTIWAKYFFAGAVNSRSLKNETWLTHYHYGVIGVDLCSENNTGVNSRALHHSRNDMIPYMYTLAMEYSLLASALLLHLWLEIATPNAGEYGATNRKRWEIWRFGFFVGLVCLPLLGGTAVFASVEFEAHKPIVYYGELVFFTLFFICSVCGLNILKSKYVVVRQLLRVDIILLCISWVGFLIVDLFTIFAACSEFFKKYNASEFIIGVTSLFELCSTGSLVAFIVTAYSRRLPLNPRGVKAGKIIRQISSFLLIVSFGFWAMRTYTFRSRYTFDYVGSNYYGDFPWFVITLLSVPFCTFFHFHSAVCLTEVIAFSTI